MDVDAVFREIGELGRQQLVYVAYMLMLNTYAAFHMIQVKYIDDWYISDITVWHLSSFFHIASLVNVLFYFVSSVALYLVMF